MSLQEPDIRCDWFRSDKPGRGCDRQAAVMAFMEQRARPFCRRHTHHPRARIEPLVRDPRVGVLVVFAIAGYSDDTLDRLIADVVAGTAGADQVLLDYVEQNGMADSWYRVTFEGRTWPEGSWMRADIASAAMAIFDAVSVERPAVLIGRTWEQVFAGNVTWQASGWTLVVFNDCGGWDYVDAVVAPDGRRWEFEKLPDAMKFWHPRSPDGWPSLPRRVIENCPSPGCQREAGHPPPHRSRTDGGHGNIIEDERESRDDAADPFLYGAQVLTRDPTP